MRDGASHMRWQDSSKSHKYHISCFFPSCSSAQHKHAHSLPSLLSPLAPSQVIMLLLRDILAMSSPLRLAAIATITALVSQPVLAQTYSKCDPIKQNGCPADPALGGSVSVDFTSGASSQFTGEGNPTYGSDGVSLTVAEAGQAPMIVSKWYIMFGKYEVTMKAAPGAGIVSSLVLQSDDLDEIDWEFIGAQPSQVQSNYFGKGFTGSYNRGGTSSVQNSLEFHTYGVEWTESQIEWQIDGVTVRTLQASDADGQFPQTPCQLKIGPWSAGDPGNAQGTIAWSKGPTDFSAGPFTMVVQSVKAVDYSTGSQYTYGGQSGAWSSIESSGGKVNGNVGGSFSDNSAPAAAPAVSGAPSGAAGGLPFTSVSANVAASATSLPGLPSGWTVNPSSGKVIPPSSAAPVSKDHSVHHGIVNSVLIVSQPVSQSASYSQPHSVSAVASSSGYSDQPKALKTSTSTTLARAALTTDVELTKAGHSSSGMENDGSRLAAQWSAGICTLFAAVTMAAFLV